MPLSPQSPADLRAAVAAANEAIRQYLDSLPGRTPRTAEERDVLAGLWEEWEDAREGRDEAGAGLVLTA